MNRRFIGSSTVAAAVAAALSVVPASLSAQMQAPTLAAAQAAQTPRDAQGHPDLNALWIGAGGPAAVANGSGVAESGDVVNLLTGRSSTGGVLGQAAVNFEQDNTLLRRMDPNVPQYKPEYWAQVQKMDQQGNYEDPAYKCMPEGVPRMGVPAQIIMRPDMQRAFLLYTGAKDTFREIPMDGRAHISDKDSEGTWMGDSIGHWEGDTFVIDSTNFTDSSWFGIAGWIHGENMHVIEKFTRQGNALTWQATIEDPDMFLKPFLMNPVRRVADPDKTHILLESLPCYEEDISHLVTNEHH